MKYHLHMMIGLIFCISTISCFAAGLNKTLNIEAAETYIRLYPKDGYLHVKEYLLSATSPHTSTDQIKLLIKNGGYCEGHFEFSRFTAMEESMRHDEGRIIGEYHLMTQETNLIEMMEDCFGKILDRKVTVTIGKSIALSFTGPDIQIRGNNAEGVYEKGDQKMIIWPSNLKYFEAVFGENSRKDYLSIAAAFGEDTASPSKTAAEIAAWKNKPTLSEKLDEAYQHDADIFRLRHLEYYGALIEEFHRKTGRYPFQGRSKHQNYVHIATPDQRKHIKGTPPQQHVLTDVEEFRRELEKELGRAVNLKFDPQKVPVAAPNFYLYMIDGDSFFFAVHLYNEHSFSAPIARRYNKVEITNREPNRRGFWNLKSLLADSEFISALSETPYKEGWFRHLEEQSK